MAKTCSAKTCCFRDYGGVLLITTHQNKEQEGREQQHQAEWDSCTIPSSSSAFKTAAVAPHASSSRRRPLLSQPSAIFLVVGGVASQDVPAGAPDMWHARVGSLGSDLFSWLVFAIHSTGLD